MIIFLSLLLFSEYYNILPSNREYTKLNCKSLEGLINYDPHVCPLIDGENEINLDNINTNVDSLHIVLYVHSINKNPGGHPQTSSDKTDEINHSEEEIKNWKDSKNTRLDIHYEKIQAMFAFEYQ